MSYCKQSWPTLVIDAIGVHEHLSGLGLFLCKNRLLWAADSWYITKGTWFTGHIPTLRPSPNFWQRSVKAAAMTVAAAAVAVKRHQLRQASLETLSVGSGSRLGWIANSGCWSLQGGLLALNSSRGGICIRYRSSHKICACLKSETPMSYEYSKQHTRFHNKHTHVTQPTTWTVSSFSGDDAEVVDKQRY